MRIDRRMLNVVHRLGLKRYFHSRAGGAETTIYEGVVLGIKLEVQFWSIPSTNRVSHWHDGFTKLGVMDTRPTYFSDAESLEKALRFELGRGLCDIPKDHEKVFGR